MNVPARVDLAALERKHPGLQVALTAKGLSWARCRELFIKQGEWLHWADTGVRVDAAASVSKCGYLRTKRRLHSVPHSVHRLAFFYDHGWLPEGDRAKIKPGNAYYVIHHGNGVRHDANSWNLHCVTQSDNSRAPDNPHYKPFHAGLQRYYVDDADGPGRCRRQSPETIAKRVASSRGQKRTPATCARISAANKGRKPTPQALANVRAAAAKRRGIPLADDLKAKLSAANKGRKHTAASKAKMSKAQEGRTHSAEAKAKMRAAKLGKPLTAEHRARIGASNLGRKHTQDTKDKISAKSKGRRHTQEVIDRIASKLRGRKPPPRTAEHVANISKAKKGMTFSVEAKARIDRGKLWSRLARQEREINSAFLSGDTSRLSAVVERIHARQYHRNWQRKRYATALTLNNLEG